MIQIVVVFTYACPPPPPKYSIDWYYMRFKSLKACVHKLIFTPTQLNYFKLASLPIHCERLLLIVNYVICSSYAIPRKLDALTKHSCGIKP